MTNPAETLELQPTAQEVVEKFITRVWEHPLVDERLRQHRETAKTALVKLVEEIGVPATDFITLPAGSIVWAVDEHSDYEYQLIFKDATVKTRYTELLKEDQTYARYVAKQDSQKINILDLPYSDEEFITYTGNLNYTTRLVTLLFTPDDYIGGNIEIARALRVKVIEALKYRHLLEEEWDFSVGSVFELLMKNWDDTSSELAQYLRNEFPGQKDRTQRIEDRLETRSRQSANPEAYKAAFRKAREAMHIPSFQEYSEALLATNGRLEVVEKYRADSIEN